MCIVAIQWFLKIYSNAAINLKLNTVKFDLRENCADIYIYIFFLLVGLFMNRALNE